MGKQTETPPSDPDAGSDGSLRGGLRVTLVAVSVAVLSVVLPVALVSDVTDAARSDAWIVTLLIMIYGGVRLSATWVSGRPRLFDFFFWLFTYIFMGLGPTVQIRADAVSTTTPGIDSGWDLPTAGVVALGIGCYEIARAVALVVERTRPRRAGAAPRPVSPVRAAMLIAVGLAVSAYFVVQMGPAAALGSREAAFAAREARWPDPAVRSVMYAAAVYPLLIATGALAQLRRLAASRAARISVTVAALLAAAVLLLVVNPIASARYTFGTVAFALAVYAGAMVTRARARLTMLLAIVAFLFVFPIADAFRTDEVRVNRSSFFGEYLANPDYDAFWQVANALSFWVDGLVQPMRQLLGSILFWVPRAVWPDKPTDTGIVLAEYRGYSFDNLSAPVWAEALVNGGVVAVVVVFVALGVALRAMDRRIVLAFAAGGVWAIVGAVLPVYMTILMRGSLLQATGATTVMIVCLILISGAAGRDPDRTDDGAGSGDPQLGAALAVPGDRALDAGAETDPRRPAGRAEQTDIQ
ncbi:hypothetical protein [Microbacterium radiodurans]|uniref:Oligosaccharide repeat unit polymerase n=1 Tax=Microbacterium radiodurans TaxID=661398 RepID=A0A5J5IMM1_9MICO|nr:hypothetical protein [Microbacterium radiodurans]KAA9084090.1 hypothetical protein F6B42_13975 [Microbacterium radiodurans]